MRGAPIRFLVTVVGGWTCIRIVMLLPETEPFELAREVLAPRASAVGHVHLHPRLTAGAAMSAASPAARLSGRRDVLLLRSGIVQAPPGSTSHAASGDRAPMQPTGPNPSVLVPATIGFAGAQPSGNRLHASAWLLARGGAAGTLSGGMIGGSQAGARLTYTIDTRRRLALSARVAAPLAGRGAEAALGIDWQPMRLPVHVLVEQRFALDGGRGGPTVMAIAGLNPTPVAAGFRLEAYAQGGAIWRRGRAEPFGDGAARLTAPVAVLGGVTLDAGIGGWAAGQRGAARVDVGPTIGLAIPVAKTRLRLSIDWRQRVTGRARPGSGPALSIGTDL